jgi:hypothetical protein
VQISAVRLECLVRKSVFLVPRTSSTPVAMWSWPTWVVESEMCFSESSSSCWSSHPFREEFLWAPIHPPLVASLVLQVVSEPFWVFIDSNQSMIQR